MIKHILTIGFLLAAFPAYAAQQTVTSGTGATHQWSVQKDRINANFTEVYGHKVVSGSVTGDELTLVLSDASTIVVDVSTLLDNTDAQTVTAFSLNSTTNILTLTLSGGNTSTVDLSDLVSAGGATTINDLTDVDTTGKATGKVLKFDASGNLVVGDDEIGAAGTGDITGVTAGTGLTGGGDTGAVTIGLSTATSDAIAANTAKISFDSTSSARLSGTSGTNTGDQDLSGKEDVGVAAGLMSTHTTTHPAPTVRDSRNQVAGSYAAALGADDNYVTNSEKTVIGNTSGTNTGDQDLSSLAPKAIPIASYAASQTLTTAQCYGAVIYVTGAATITLPAVATGMSVTIIADAAVVVTIDPDGTEILRKDGVDGTGGATIASTGTIGDIATLTYHSAGKWYAATSGW